MLWKKMDVHELASDVEGLGLLLDAEGVAYMAYGGFAAVCYVYGSWSALFNEGDTSTPDWIELERDKGGYGFGTAEDAMRRCTKETQAYGYFD